MINRLLDISENVVFDEPMSAHTSFRIGGNADAFASVKGAEEVKALSSFCKKKRHTVYVYGKRKQYACFG